MNIKLNLFPGGLRHALTLSYDDGMDHDIRLLRIMNEYGIRGTFHLNSARLGKDGAVKREDVAELYRGHEVSVHTVTHPYLTQITDSSVLREIMKDKETLEELCGYPVRGMSWPFGAYTDHVISLARGCGMEYSRTVEATNAFDIPENFMKWHPTAHHNQDLDVLWERFINRGAEQMLLFYVWGHSYEFDRDDNWDKIENFCRMAGGRDDVWYAANIEIKEYIDACRGLRFSADERMVYNSSCSPVWISVDGEPVCIPAGELSVLRRDG